jgi:hypothetical protein
VLKFGAMHASHSARLAASALAKAEIAAYGLVVLLAILLTKAG